MRMTLDLLPLAAASLACIVVLALFARTNKRKGWVKERGVAPRFERRVSLGVAPGAVRLRHSDVTDFSLQLAHFQQSLAAAVPEPVEQRERIRTAVT